MEWLLDGGDEERLIGDAVIAGSLRRRSDFWRLREAVSEAQKAPKAAASSTTSPCRWRASREFLRARRAVVERVCPGARPVPFGHFGDGNCTTTSRSPKAWTRRVSSRCGRRCRMRCFELVAELGGSISAEHGIGQMKREALRLYRTPVELDMMRADQAGARPQGHIESRQTAVEKPGVNASLTQSRKTLHAGTIGRST